LQAQLQAAFEFQRRGGQGETRNDQHASHSFRGERSVRTVEAAGFATAHPRANRFNTEQRQVMDNELFQYVGTQDFIEYGFEPEFIGRLPVRVVCEELAADDLYQIMKYSEGSILRQYERAFRAYGSKSVFETRRCA